MATIKYLGHSTTLITTESGRTVLIDPWINGNPSCPIKITDLPDIDYICLTHGHSDHTGSVLELAERFRPTIFATYELAMLLVKDGVDQTQLQLMNKGGTVASPRKSGIKVTLTNAFHSSSYDAKDGKTYYAGEPCGVVVHLESGTTIYHAGDTSLFSDMKLIGQLYRPKVSLLPIGDRFTMGGREAAIAAELIGSEYVIPIHYKTFPALAQDASELTEHLKAKPVVLKPGEDFEL